MPVSIRRIIVTTAFALGLAWSFVVSAAVENSGWSLRVWQADGGLPDNDVTGVVQTSDGYLWVGTHAGLARFDGVRFVRWPLPIASGGTNTLIRALLLSQDNSLWVGLEAEHGFVIGLSDHDTNLFNGASGIPDYKPLGMTQTPDGAIWASYADGAACRFANHKMQRFSSREGLTGAGGCWLTTAIDGTLWYVKAKRVGVFHDGHFEARFTLPDASIRIAPARDGGIWILAGQRLLKCSNGKDPQLMGELTTQRPGGEPAVIYEDRAGGLWLGTTAGGLFYRNGNTIVPVETSHSAITSVMEDREDNIWVGTEGGGLDRLRHRILELHGLSQGIAFESVRSICEDDGGVIWAAGANGALVRFMEGQWRMVTNGNGWAGGHATCVVSDHRGGVWIGTRHAGLVHWRDGVFTEFGHKNGLGGETMYSLLTDRRGDLWIGLEQTDCVQRLRDGVFKTYAQPLNSRTVRAIAEDAAGKIWLGTSGGVLFRVDEDALVNVTGRALQPSKPIRALHGTPDGGLWIGYSGAGVGWLRGGQFSHFGTAQGLPDNNICGIESDHNGALWFTSSHGICQVREREFETVADGSSSRLLAIEFGRDEALLNLEGSYGYWPSTTRGKDGRLWFATRSGLVTAWPDRLQPSRIAPVVLIEQVVVDGLVRPMPPDGGSIILPPGHRELEVGYTALSFAAPESVLFQHEVEGWDKGWSEPRPLRTVTLSRLPAGQYQFRVAARNAAGVWNRQGAGFRFEVEPFVWQRWWFRLAAVVLFTVAVIATVRYLSFRRLRLQLLRLEQESALHRDRARIALDLHDDLGANLTQIALLSELAQNDFAKPAEAQGHIDQIFRTAKSLTRSLDEIVWAVNPKNDSLDRFVAHLCTYAPEFLHTAGVRCRLDVPVEIPALPLAPDVRHHLHLAVKEALHNVVKHAGASEVRMQLRIGEDTVSVMIEDDGRGISPDAGTATEQDGLWNFRARMLEVGGHCEQQSVPGRGTKISFTVPLRPKRAGQL